MTVQKGTSISNKQIWATKLDLKDVSKYTVSK